VKRPQQLILPAYLLLCLLLGGSSRAIWGSALLQLLAVAILAWSIMTRDPQRFSRPARRLMLIVAATGLLLFAQLIPLPPGTWTALPGRDFFKTGYELIGMPLPWLPISLDPYYSLATALTLLPPLALLVGMLRLRAWNSRWMIASIILGAAISIMLGIIQVSGGGKDDWYFYERTNLGIAVGTFANGNHFATLLLVSVPLLAALAGARWRSARKQPQRSLTVALGLAAAAILAIGIVMNRSSAMLLLGPPVVAASAMVMLRPSAHRLRQGLLGIGLLLAVAAAAVVFVSRDLPSWGTSASIESRTEFWSKSLQAAEDQALTGSGIGTFQQIYRRYEDPGEVDRWYVNHAHNDYLEIAVEGGIPAVILLMLFVIWWAGRARAAWLSPNASVEQQAAAVASAAILLHSLIDYPLRTAGIAAVMAVCVALLAGARGAVGDEDAEGREPVRHATL
jgi:O-antigen ligase